MKTYGKSVFALVALASVTLSVPCEFSFAAGLPRANRTNAIRSVVEARLSHRGSLDPAFGNAGKVLTSDNGTGQCFVKAALQPDGKIVALDCVPRDGYLCVIARTVRSIPVLEKAESM